MRLTVLYYSRSGNTEKMANAIVHGMGTVENVEARAMPIDKIETDFIESSVGVVLGTPTYLADVAADVKVWLDAAMKYKLAGKLGGAFATADYVHGGGENAIKTILNHMLVLGMLAYSGGGASGKPVIHFGPVALKEDLDSYADTFGIFGQRFAIKAAEVLG